jgi:hypothetical protein
MSLTSTLALPPTDLIEESANEVLAEEVSNFLQNTQGAMLSSALDEAEERRLAQITVIDDLMGLDEDELDRFLLTDDEVKIKERVWVELNKDYLEALAGELTIERRVCLEVVRCFAERVDVYLQRKVNRPKLELRIARVERFVSRWWRKLFACSGLFVFIDFQWLVILFEHLLIFFSSPLFRSAERRTTSLEMHLRPLAVLQPSPSGISSKRIQNTVNGSTMMRLRTSLSMQMTRRIMMICILLNNPTEMRMRTEWKLSRRKVVQLGLWLVKQRRQEWEGKRRMAMYLMRMRMAKRREARRAMRLLILVGKKFMNKRYEVV